jgi:hypothetical protein
VKAEKSNVTNYLNQGANSPNALIAKGIDILQERAGPLYSVPIAAKATPLKTAQTKVSKSIAIAIDPTKPKLATTQPKRKKSTVYKVSIPKNLNYIRPLLKPPPLSLIL